MNNKIKELAEQAGGRTKSWCACHDYPYFQLLDEDISKFAELIVLECMEVCKSRVGNSDYNTARMHCVSDLKEHFGVE